MRPVSYVLAFMTMMQHLAADLVLENIDRETTGFLYFSTRSLTHMSGGGAAGGAFIAFI